MLVNVQTLHSAQHSIIDELNWSRLLIHMIYKIYFWLLLCIQVLLVVGNLPDSSASDKAPNITR